MRGQTPNIQKYMETCLPETPGLAAPVEAVVSKPRGKPESTASQWVLVWPWEAASAPPAICTPAPKYLCSTCTAPLARTSWKRSERGWQKNHIAQALSFLPCKVSLLQFSCFFVPKGTLEKREHLFCVCFFLNNEQSFLLSD